MDVYEAEYNFRFEEPGGTTITQYPRGVQNSLRQKPETRKEKRKKTIERKKQEEL
jgi:protein KRI1